MPHLRSPFEGAKVLTGTEASKLRPAVNGFLHKAAEYADEGLSNINKAHETCEVWTGPTGLSEQDYDELTDVLIERAQLDAVTAQAVRGMANLYHRWKVALILGPKTMASYRFVQENGGFVWPF